MDNKNHNYKNLGKNIENAISEGLKSGDFTELNQTITDSVNTVLDDVGRKLNSYTDLSPNAQNLSAHKEVYSNGEYTRRRQEQLEREKEARRQLEAKRRQQEEKRRRELQARKAAGKMSTTNSNTTEIAVPMNYIGLYSSTIYTVIGGVGTGITAVSLLSTLPQMLLGKWSLAGLVSGGVFLIIFGLMLNKGIMQGKQLKLAKRIGQMCGKRGYIEIDSLAKSMGRSNKGVLRTIRKMFNLGFFPQGHLDDNNQNLILTDAVYEQYRETKYNQAKTVYDTTAREVNEDDFAEGLSEEEKKELASMISEGNDYIKRLHELNDRIPGEVISKKLARLEGLLKEIFKRVREHPEQMGRMHELMEYYLPTMIKLVSAYEEYDKVSEPGDDIIKAKQDIENTLDTINVAFRKLLNNLFKDSVWDVTTDAQVLKTVLVQKGLASDMEGE